MAPVSVSSAMDTSPFPGTGKDEFGGIATACWSSQASENSISSINFLGVF